MKLVESDTKKRPALILGEGRFLQLIAIDY